MRGSLSMNLKKRMVKTLVWSVALYGAETWTMKKKYIERLEAFEMWVWRRMMRIDWMEHITNREVLGMIGEERSLVDTIQKRQRNWIGHILRGNSLLKVIIEGRMMGRKIQGRPRMKLLDWMMNGEKGKTYDTLKREAQERQQWRHHQRTCP